MKLTKKQKNYLIRIAIILVLAIVAYFVIPEDESNKGGSDNDTELSADGGDVTDDDKDSGKTDENSGDSDSDSGSGDDSSDKTDNGNETDKDGQENDSDDKQDGEDNQEGSDKGNQGSTWVEYEFRKDEYLTEHFEKHGEEFDYANEEEYLEGANRVINSEEALHKTEAEDGDYIYYLEASNEFVVVSKDGYIRTYFKPSAGIDYYNRQ